MTKEGEVEQHYLKCPFCEVGRQHLKSRICMVCGARPLYIIWEQGETISPELVMVTR